MTRKSTRRWLRQSLAAASWIGAVSAVQAAVGPEMERAARQLQDRIELQLQLKDHRILPLVEPQPNRSREESIEPWELVGV